MGDIKVLIGKDGWLFLQNDTNRVVEQNNGTLKLTEIELKKWLRTLESRFAILKNRGIKYYFLIAPNKESIYPEYLPDDYIISDDRLVYQLLNACKPYNLPVYYPVDTLKLYKSEHQLYPSGNTHWNGIGGFIAYQYVMNIIKKDFDTNILDWEEINFVDEETSQDLGNKLTPPRTSIFSWGKVKLPRAQIIYDNKAINSGKIQITLNKNTSLPTAAIFHDSFIEFLLPFIMESFSKIYLFHTPCLDYDLIEKINPDVVISEMVERFLIQPPVDF
ncbi:alginate O-acetyltransferase AlgX-related protein [Sporomusa sp.]|uniref:alginate O-acetyltransferase AlgX-related protein n=1 Tax=Sporomusa sp. TaxID=2078658 RepID=UPI002C1CEC89|nr:hypothetical protein [Sporomusa sp.]HWR41607.1 hypothetical protein [Sporomusa sp.]